MEIRTQGTVDDWALFRWTDNAGDALRIAPPSVDAIAELPLTPFGIAYPPHLEGIGRIYLWANGFATRPSELLLERAFATRYAKAASALIKQYARRGVPMETTHQHLQRAQALQAEQRWAESLAASVAAAEASVVSLARARLERMHGHTAFLWGGSIEALTSKDIVLQTLIPPLNLITIRTLEDTESWRALIGQAQGIRTAISAFWVGDALAAASMAQLRDVIAAYRGSVRYWNIAANLQCFKPSNDLIQQISTLCEIGRTVDFGIVRLLHGVHGLYKPRSPYTLLVQCIEAGVAYEAVHLEWHWFDGTLYDFDQLLERYGELGKPVYLSISTPPEAKYGVFSRAEPLAWVEQACLIALSKPYVIALQVPMQASESSGGAIGANHQPSKHWQQVAQVAAWNASLLD
ncbi:MAG: hypothetical protein ACUVV1_01170 [Fimbriimonadales bacterium]